MDATTLLLLVIALGVTSIAVGLALSALRLKGAAAKLEALIDRYERMAPAVERVLQQTEAELVELKSTTRNINGITEDIGHFSSMARNSIIPFLARAAAVSLGARAGFRTLKNRMVGRKRTFFEGDPNGK